MESAPCCDAHGTSLTIRHVMSHYCRLISYNTGEENMSANENIQIAQKGYADFGRGDIPALLAAMDDNVVWVTPDIGRAPGGTYRGKAGVAQFFKEVGETWEFQAFEPREYIASGDQVVVLGSYAFTSR